MRASTFTLSRVAITGLVFFLLEIPAIFYPFS
jgi:hypothetical protein